MYNIEIMWLGVSLVGVVGGTWLACYKFRKSRNKIVEFRLDGFNDLGLEFAFSYIRGLYNEILHKDPLWHYFYEGHYSLIRCSKKYMKSVKKFLKKNAVEFKEPVVWQEGFYVTKKYQHIYQHLFHYTSVLAIELDDKKDHAYYLLAGDRIIHPFYNQSLYPAKRAGLCERIEKSGMNFQYWEAEQMTTLATDRAYHIGRVVGQEEMRKVNKKE